MTIDWTTAPEGATHYSPETDATHAVFYRDDFKQMWIEKWPNLGWQEAHALSEHERPIRRPTSTAIPVDSATQAEISSLRTQAIADAAEIEQLRAENERLKVGHDRYEILRRLNVVQFQALYTRALQSPIPFDELVDILGDL